MGVRILPLLSQAIQIPDPWWQQCQLKGSLFCLEVTRPWATEAGALGCVVEHFRVLAYVGTHSKSYEKGQSLFSSPSE